MSAVCHSQGETKVNSRHTTPDLLTTTCTGSYWAKEKASNGKLPRCLCQIPKNLYCLKAKRPSAPQSLKHPEFPSTLGLQANQREKVGASALSYPRWTNFSDILMFYRRLL